MSMLVTSKGTIRRLDLDSWDLRFLTEDKEELEMQVTNSLTLSADDNKEDIENNVKGLRHRVNSAFKDGAIEDYMYLVGYLDYSESRRELIFISRVEDE